MARSRARRRVHTKDAADAAAKGRKKASPPKTTSKTASGSKTRSTTTRKRSTTARKTTTARKPTTAPKKPTLPALGAGERYFVLNVPYELRDVASAYKAKWVKGIGHVYVGKTLHPALKRYASKDFSYERWTEDDLNKTIAPTAKTAHPMTPRDHQKDAIRKIIASAKKGYRGFIEADDVGLGKTLSCAFGALGALKVRGGKNVLIVCPKGVMEHWAVALRSLPETPGTRYCIINYESAKKLLEEPASAQTAKRARTKNKRIASQGTPKVQWDVIIADESHKLKNVFSSQRSKVFDRIARYADASAHAPFVIWASATIGQHPAELGYLSPLIAQLTKNKNQSIDTWHVLAEDVGLHGKFDASAPKKFTWTEQPQEQQADTKRMNRLLFSPQSPSIRRVPTDIAGWPAKNFIIIPFELDPADMELYESLWTEFREDMDLAPKGNDPKGLAVLLRFRQKTSLLKIDETLEQTLDYLENGRKVIINADFAETVDLLHERIEAHNYRVEEFNGRNVNDREEARLRFQKGQADVMIFSVKEGISLHAGEQLPDGTHADMLPRETIVHDIPYSALDLDQVSGRAHRDGQFSNIIIPCVKGTVEEKITNTLVDRVESMKNITGDDVSFVDKLRSILVNG